MVFVGSTPSGRQLFALDLQTTVSQQLTEHTGGVSGEIVAPGHREVVYQTHDSVFATHVDTRATRLLYVLPSELHGNISTLNADETMLAGVRIWDPSEGWALIRASITAPTVPPAMSSCLAPPAEARSTGGIQTVLIGRPD